MSGTQTSTLHSSPVTGQNSANLFKALDNAMNSAFESFMCDLQGISRQNGGVILQALCQRIREKVVDIQIQVPSSVRIRVLPSRDQSEEFFYLKAWVLSRDFEGDTICITRFLGFHNEKPHEELN